MYKNIQIIINPKSGNDEPILSYIQDTFAKSEIKWEVLVTTKAGQATEFTNQAIASGKDCIAVYGGDGTVSEVALAAYKANVPIFIIPGGTANVMAKELEIPTDSIKALELLRDGNLVEKDMDIGFMNDEPFFIRVNFGLLADMVTKTSRSLKNKFGIFSYVFSAIDRTRKGKLQCYEIEMDNETVIEEGAALVVANSGNIGITNVSIAPDIFIDDGLLDVILLTQNDILSLAKMTGNSLLNQEASVIKKWKSKKVNVKLRHPQTIICDDSPRKAEKFEFRIQPGALKVLIPQKVTDGDIK